MHGLREKEAMNGARRIRSAELSEHQYIEGYTRCLESKQVEYDEGKNIAQVWDM